MNEQAYNEISPLIKDRCALPNYWYALEYKFQELIEAVHSEKRRSKFNNMKEMLGEKIRNKLDEYCEQAETTDAPKELLEDFLDELDTIIDDWYEENPFVDE